MTSHIDSSDDSLEDPVDIIRMTSSDDESDLTIGPQSSNIKGNDNVRVVSLIVKSDGHAHGNWPLTGDQKDQRDGGERELSTDHLADGDEGNEGSAIMTDDDDHQSLKSDDGQGTSETADVLELGMSTVLHSNTTDGSVTRTITHVSEVFPADQAQGILDAVIPKCDTTIETRRNPQTDVKEVHVHLTNVHNPAAIALGGSVVVTPPGEDKEETPSPPTEIQKLRSETEKRFEKWTKGMVKTKSIQDVLDKITKGRTWITITGCPGEGKTTTGYLVLKHLHGVGRQVFDIKTPRDYFTVKESKRSVFMFNDIFGSISFEMDNRWREVLFDILAMMEHHSDEDLEAGENRGYQPVVIFVSRSNVLKEAYIHLGRFKDLAVNVEGTVDLTHEFKMFPEERMKIWKYHSQRYKVQIDEKRVKEVCKMSLPHGFPHCCRLFASMYSKNKSLSMESFFSKPIEFLNQTIESLMTDSITGSLLREMLKNNGSLDLDSISDTERRFQFASVVEIQSGTYLSTESNIVSFHHPSVYDSVAYVVCLKDPLFVIENCSLLFINDRVRIDGLNYGIHEKQKHTVTIGKRYSTPFLQRLKNEMERGNLSCTLAQEAFHDEEFVSQFMNSVLPVSKWYRRKSRPDRIREIMHRFDKETKQSFIFLSTKSTSEKILEFICNSVKLNEEELSDVLFGICKHVSVPALKLLSRRYELNCNVTNSVSETPLLIAATKGSEELLKLILQYDVDVQKTDRLGDTCLHAVCRYGTDGNGDVVKMLIDRGADVNQLAKLYPGRPLNIACNKGHKNVVKTLIECGADVTQESRGGVTPLHDASWMGHAEIAEYLIDRGANINKYNRDTNDGKTPLHDACIKGFYDVVKLLLDRGADLSKIADVTHRSSLHYASLMGHVEVAKLLLNRGAEINKLMKGGRTPFHDACFLGNTDVVKLLLDQEATVNQPMDGGKTSLHDACFYGRTDVVSLLLDSGADINLCDDASDTALHKAYLAGHRDVIDLLIEKGADVNITNFNGLKPVAVPSSKTTCNRIYYDCSYHTEVG